MSIYWIYLWRPYGVLCEESQPSTLLKFIVIADDTIIALIIVVIIVIANIAHC